VELESLLFQRRLSLAEDKKSQMAAMRSEMAMFESSGKRGRGLELAKTWHADILAKYLGWPSSVDAERAFSVAGVLCTKVISRLSDN